MRTTFFGLETARRALFAQQRALDLTGHNIANANTPGYSRQVARLEATDPFTMPSFLRPGIPGQIGTGMEIAAIERMRDAFLEGQIRYESQALGRWEVRRDQLSQVELIVNEPSDTGVRGALDAFWKALQDLSKNPENGATRAVVVQKAVALTNVLNHTYLQLEQLRAAVDEAVAVKVDRIDTLATQIAELNDKIARARAVGDNA
ncbi:MAG: flagellar hook-associated protein FlgK, partial [Bacillota bacterium]|nr:flagellar hook-associated protein FlgK [Bacillota bacterium]